MHYRKLESTPDILEHSRHLRAVALAVIADSHRVRQEARSLIERSRAEDRERQSAAERSSVVTATSVC